MALRLGLAVALVIPLWAIGDVLRQGPGMALLFLGPRLVCSAVLVVVALAIRTRRGDSGVLTAVGLVVAQVDAGWMVPQTLDPAIAVLGTTLCIYACGTVLLVGWWWTTVVGVAPFAGIALAWPTTGAGLDPDQLVVCICTLLTATLTASLAHAVRVAALRRESRLAGELETEQARTREMAAEMARLSLVDPLTGLVNRRGWDAALEAARSGPMAVLLVDVDHFKQVNDTGGHAAGDRALQEVAAELTRGVRADDLVARLGGDEFGVLLRGLPEDVATDSASRIAEIVRARVADMVDLPVTLSIGVAGASGPGVDVDALLAVADGRLYRAKASRNAVVGAAHG